MNLNDAVKFLDDASPRMREVAQAIRAGGGWGVPGMLLKMFNWLAKDDHEAAQLLWRHLGNEHSFRMRRAPKSKQKDLSSDGAAEHGTRHRKRLDLRGYGQPNPSSGRPRWFRSGHDDFQESGDE